jgi:serine protease Do
MVNKSLWIALLAAAAGALVFSQFDSVAASPPVDDAIHGVGSSPASFADVIEAVQPAVVNISVSGTVPGYGSEIPPGVPFEDFEDFLRRFFERQAYPGNRGGPTFQGMGSGFVVSPEGYVVTNDHVVGKASEIVVTFQDGKRLPATLVGTDAKTDLAVLKVESESALPYARFGDSERARVGDWVVAIGNPFGLGGSATAGIVSARGRDIQSGPFDDFLQIDAPINQGNSGGPLFDLEGRVIGINTAIYSPNGGNVGIGFAIPSKLAEKVIEELRESGRVERGWLGVTIQPIDEEIAKSLGLDSEKGALVASVVPESPAARGGIEPGDVILEIDGRAVDRVKDLSRQVAEISPDETIELQVLRRGERKSLDVRIGRSPADTTMISGVLGLTLGENRARGAVVVAVDPEGPAAARGIQEGDVIVMVGQSPVANAAEARAAIERHRASGRESVLLQVLRGSDATFVAVPFA